MSDKHFNQFEHVMVRDLDIGNTYSPSREVRARHIKDFIKAIQKRCVGIEFAYTKIEKATKIEKEVDRGTMYAYYPDELFARAAINYCDARDNQDHDTVETYNVYSPNIANGKSKTTIDSLLYFKLSSSNMATAVRNFSKYAQEYSLVDMLGATANKFGVDLSTGMDALDDKVDSVGSSIVPNAGRALRSDKSLLSKEMKQLFLSGHKFSPEFHDKITEYYELLDTFVESRKSIENMTFVHVGVDYTGEHLFGTQGVYCMPTHERVNVGDTCKITRFSPLPTQAPSFKGRELPDDLLSKVSVLSCAEDGTYLDCVGYKVCNELYYVAS